MIFYIATLILFAGASRGAEIDDFNIPGMAKEVQGLWLGEEKFLEEGEVFPFCDRVLFQPGGNLEAFLYADGTCQEIGVDQLTGEITGDWFGQVSIDSTFYGRVQRYGCIPSSECPRKVTRRFDEGDVVTFEEYKLRAKSCGGHLLKDIVTKQFFCVLWQLALLASGDERKAVLTLTFSPGYDNRRTVVCPKEVTYRADEIKADPGIEGSTQLVLKQSFNDTESDLLNPCNWDCFQPNCCPDDCTF